jgi:hypothetical protein
MGARLDDTEGLAKGSRPVCVRASPRRLRTHPACAFVATCDSSTVESFRVAQPHRRQSQDGAVSARRARHHPSRAVTVGCECVCVVPAESARRRCRDVPRRVRACVRTFVRSFVRRVDATRLDGRDDEASASRFSLEPPRTVDESKRAIARGHGVHTDFYDDPDPSHHKLEERVKYIHRVFGDVEGARWWVKNVGARGAPDDGCRTTRRFQEFYYFNSRQMAAYARTGYDASLGELPREFAPLVRGDDDGTY